MVVQWQHNVLRFSVFALFEPTSSSQKLIYLCSIYFTSLGAPLSCFLGYQLCVCSVISQHVTGMLRNVQLVAYSAKIMFGAIFSQQLSFLWIQHESLHFKAIVWHSFVHSID